MTGERDDRATTGRRLSIPALFMMVAGGSLLKWSYEIESPELRVFAVILGLTSLVWLMGVDVTSSLNRFFDD